MTATPIELMRAAMEQLDWLLQKPEPERSALLNELAISQPQLHAMVVQLLKAERDASGSGFLEPPLHADATSALKPDTNLGPYRIIRQLGAGGMGEVWLARRADGLYEGNVAIKTLHPHLANTAVRERFTREAHILGKLTHKNIARLHDAGVTETGVTYLVLEYVQGETLDAWCDARSLSIRARLELFLSVCSAVAHAHAHLVVHRDLKPSNILVAQSGGVKLLDFGVAKLVQGDESNVEPTALTQFGGRIFTPEYAAPEQILGEAVTTATDVYALGLLLYGLLSGKRPFGVTGATGRELERAILNAEPFALAALPTNLADKIARQRSTTPSKLTGVLRGDLEFIVARALRKAPKDRYGSVLALAVDIERYLQQQPIEAREGSGAYRLGRLVQRHRAAALATVISITALLAGSAVALWQLQVARAAQQRAEESKEFIASIFRSADPFYTGKDSMTAAELLTLARQRIDRELVAQPQNAVELLTLVGESQLNLHQSDAAKETIAKAIEMAENLQPRDDVLIAEARARLAVIASESGDWTRVRALAALALPDLRKHQLRTGRMLNEMLVSLGYAESDEGNPKAAIALVREGVAAVTAALGPKHSETISSRSHLVHFLGKAGQFDEARRIAEQVLRDARAQASPGERGALVIQAEGRYGTVLLELGEPQAAISHLNAAVDLAAQIYGPKNPARYLWLSELARAQGRLGDFKALLATRQRDFEGQEPGILQARSLTNFARVTLAARKVPESLDRLRRAIKLEQQYDTGKGSWVLLAQSDYGAALALSGRFDEAERLLQVTIPLARESAKQDSLASTWNAIGLTRQLQLQWIESERAFREALAGTSSSDNNQKQRAEALLGIGIARLELGQAADAEIWLRQADEAAGKTFLGMMPLRADIVMNLGRAMLVQGKIVAANELFATANTYWQGFDATNRCAGQAAYWSAQGHLAAGASQEARTELIRAMDIFRSSTLPGDVRQAKHARQLVTQLRQHGVPGSDVL